MLAALCFFARNASAQHETAPQVTGPAPETSQAAPVTTDVTVGDARMRTPDDGNWLLYGRTYDHQRFSPLTQITRDNVKKLAPVAIIQAQV